MSDGAVFGSMEQAQLWNDLLSADSNKNNDKRIGGIKKVLDKVILSDEKYDSPILCKLIEIVAREEANGWQDDVRDLVSRARSRDCHPALTAALVFARKGLITDAETCIDQLGEAPDKCMFHLVKAQIELARENDREAIGHLNLALCSDKTIHDIYVMLSRIDNRINWEAVEACELMAAGMTFKEPADDGSPELSLYRIYREWYRGSHENATRMLMGSSQFDEKVPAYCVLSARMSRDEGDWHSAQMMLEEASRSVENDVSLLCELGEAYLGGGNYDLALARFRNAEAFDIGNPKVVRGMIRANMALGKNNEALQGISEFLDSEMSTYEDYEELTRYLLEMGFFTEAAEAAMKIIYTHPGDATACIVLSKVAINEGNYREAEKYAKDGVASNKNNAEALAQLARVYMALRRTSKAASTAKKAVSADRRSIVALMTQVDIYRETGDLDHAVEACRAVLEVDPANTQAAEILANLEMKGVFSDTAASDEMPKVVGAEDFVRLISTLMTEGKYTEVEKLCKDNDHKYGGDKDVRRIRGNAEFALGEYLKASASFASAAALMKDDAEIWHSKGLADEKFGDFDSAEEAYGKAILLNMYNPAYWISNGCIKEKKGDYVAAVKSFNRAIELDPASSYALVRKAAIFASNGMYSEALNFLELAEATDSKNTNIQIVKMKICLKAARYTDAVYIGKKLMKKDPDASTVATYARANLGLKDYGLAKKVLEKALANDPDSYELLTAYKDLAIQTADTETTVKVCNQILKIEPLDRAAKKALADALMRLGRSDEANLIYASIKTDAEAGTENKEEDDPAAMFNIAKSMMEAGDLVSAARLTDRAMKSDPDNIDYALLRATIYRKAGDKRVADMFLSQYLERNPTNGSVHEAIGDIRVADGDLKGAALAYGKAIQNGIRKPAIYVKLGNIQERMGAYSNAVTNYTSAVMLDPHDADANRCLAYVQFKTKDYDSAMRSIQASITSEPSGEAYAILAMIYQAKKDRAGVRDAYQGFLRFDNNSEEWVQAVITALNSVGLRTEASLLKGRLAGGSDEEGAVEVSADIKRYAERILRRAYRMGVEFNDPDLLDEMGSDQGMSQNAVSYLSDIPDYGEVLYGTNEYEHLEELSYHTILRAKNKDIEAVTLDTAYVAGSAKDVDEAKLLLAYIRAATTSKLPREIPEEFVKMGSSTKKTDSLEQVMLDNKIGVFSARMVMSCVHE